MPTHPFIAGLAIYGCYEALRKVGLVKEVDCPPEVSDATLNTAHKKAAATEYNYGPQPFGRALSTVVGKVRGLPVLSPAGNDPYWLAKATRDSVPEPEARKRICGNCKAFDVTPTMVACGGASERPILVPDSSAGPPRLTTPVGYCQMHHFKCSALRTCDSWTEGGPKGGGPITDYVKP